MKTYVLIYFYKAQGARCHITEKEIMFVKYFIKLRQVIRIKFSQYLNRNLNIVCQIYLMIRTFFFHFSMKNKISSRSDTCLLIGAFFN